MASMASVIGLSPSAASFAENTPNNDSRATTSTANTAITIAIQPPAAITATSSFIAEMIALIIAAMLFTAAFAVVAAALAASCAVRPTV